MANKNSQIEFYSKFSSKIHLYIYLGRDARKGVGRSSCSLFVAVASSSETRSAYSYSEELSLSSPISSLMVPQMPACREAIFLCPLELTLVAQCDAHSVTQPAPE